VVFMRLGGIILSCLLAASMAAGSDETPSDSKSRPRVRFGGLMVGAGYSSGPFWYPRYGYYDPLWYSPYFYPGLFYGYAQQPNMGQVKLETSAKDALVYVDGAYAGSAEKLKRFWLAPGVYNLEVRDTSQRVFRQRVYVLTGKTLAIRAALQIDTEKETK
jgi:hypothetical protein